MLESFNGKLSLLALATLCSLLLIGIVFASQPQLTMVPTACTDSDGNCNIANLNSSDGVFESVNLKTSPYGWINVTGWGASIPSGNTIDNATLHLSWKTDTSRGAGNIYVGYLNGTSWVDCAGPYGESGAVILTNCSISGITLGDMNNIKVRFKGEDLDSRIAAFAYVDYVYLDVNYSAPPRWRNLAANSILIPYQNSIVLASQAYDDIGLGFAILSTNETGSWINYTDGTYGSPFNMNGASDTWTWSNFTWGNSSFKGGMVGWKIYYNNTNGKQNVTDNSTFYSQFYETSAACTDSDGNCNIANLNSSDGVFESVNLKTSPYGWINVTGWGASIPSGNIIDNAMLHLSWKTDTSRGAGNIYVGYLNGTSWVDCAGPYGESGAVILTNCSISGITLGDMNNIKVRFKGEDLDSRIAAFAYVDYVYLDVNYSEQTIGYLEVNLASPPSPTSVIQNDTFVINATVICRDGSCDNVSGIVRYNLSSSSPDTPINTTIGDSPLYINETPASALKSCGMLYRNQLCQLNWTVNATGAIGSYWKVDVNFNSTLDGVQENETNDSTISINYCTEDFSLSWSSISFGILNPSTGPIEAPGNPSRSYNISLNPGSCNMDIYIRGTDLTNATNSQLLGIGNVTWSNLSNSYSSSLGITKTDSVVSLNTPPSTNITTWYWMIVPSIYAGYYNGTVTITGVKTV